MKIPWDPKFIETLKKRSPVFGIDPCGGFGYHLDFSIPAIATAIHAGHRVRDELLPLMAISSGQRRFEEDTGTDVMVQGHPNAVWGIESRAVYDLNRPPDMALPLVPEKFWGTRVYQMHPSLEMNQRSLDSHDAFYRFLGTLMTRMLDLFGYCIVYDIHSYNITRQKAKGVKSPPVFNLGTAALDRSRWSLQIDSWLENLRRVSLPGIETTVAENEVFSGQGEFCKTLCQWHPNILVLPTEVSKVYMNEETGEVYPDLLNAVKQGLTMAMASHCVSSREQLCPSKNQISLGKNRSR